MKRIGFYSWALITALIIASCSTVKELPEITVSAQSNAQSSHVPVLHRKLKAIPEIVDLRILETDDHFIEHYELWFEQHSDPTDPSSPTFKQRVLLAHASDDAPVIVELQGYHIYTAKSGELATLFKGNQITIEHRYFEKSKPEGPLPWKTLTVQNAAMDQHAIITVLKKAIYPENKFITTGISKGGQTTMIHRSMYPDDVDASVCYVAPLNFKREDPRIWNFLETVGTKDERRQIQDFQRTCFKRKNGLLEELNKLADERGYEWSFSREVALEYYILEYSFAFWQWGASFEDIPSSRVSDKELLDHVLAVSGISFFEDSGVEKQRSFFYAAMSEMGIYDYDIRPFKSYVSQDKYNFEFTVPGSMQVRFDPSPMEKVNSFIQDSAKTMLFIYGELDTWSATAVELSDEAKARGLRKYVLKGGNHGTRIRHFSEGDRKNIISTIEGWIGVK